MKKQNIFLLLIWIILYISYLIIVFSYKEYKRNTSIEYITQLNKDIKENIIITNGLIEYKSSRAYRNKILKEQQWFKNKWEKVVYLTTEENFNKYTQPVEINKQNSKSTNPAPEEGEVQNMSIYEKWIFLLFNKKN